MEKWKNGNASEEEMREREEKWRERAF